MPLLPAHYRLILGIHSAPSLRMRRPRTRPRASLCLLLHTDYRRSDIIGQPLPSSIAPSEQDFTALYHRAIRPLHARSSPRKYRRLLAREVTEPSSGSAALTAALLFHRAMKPALGFSCRAWLTLFIAISKRVAQGAAAGSAALVAGRGNYAAFRTRDAPAIHIRIIARYFPDERAIIFTRRRRLSFLSRAAAPCPLPPRRYFRRPASFLYKRYFSVARPPKKATVMTTPAAGER